jgi:uncharacterized protein involved in exopolysaccharide biosynthesis
MQSGMEIHSASNLSARAAIEAFFRKRRLCFSVALTVLAATALVTFLTPKQYSSEMKFLVQNARESVVVTPEQTSPRNIANNVTEEQVNSELEILHSHDVLDPVADPEWISPLAGQLTPRTVRSHEKRLSSLEKRFGTEIVRKTNIINVSLLADTPEKAQEQLARLSEAYLAERRRLQRPKGASEFFTAEAERNRKAWDEASRKLVDFQQEHQLLSLPDSEQELEGRITEDQDHLFAADATLHELDAQLSEASRRMHDMPERLTTQEKSSQNQQSVEKLSTLAVELENRRTALLTKFNANDRSVRELDQQIATTKAALNDAVTMRSHEEITDVDPAWQSLHTNYIQNQINRRSTVERRAKLQARLVTLRQGLETLRGLTVEFNNLEAQTNELKENYRLYAQKRDQAQIEDAMDAHNLMNVAVAQRPTIAYVAARPKPLLNALLGAVTSLFLGLCAVYFAEIGRNTVATPRELEAISRYPVLATVPQLPSLFESAPPKEARIGKGNVLPLAISYLRRRLRYGLVSLRRVSRAWKSASQG